MANSNTNKTSKEDKILFCRQYFQELKLFLSDFDISEAEGKNTLSMHPLLIAYDIDVSNNKKVDPSARRERNETYAQTKKENAKWAIANVSDADLMLAIEEFYHITELYNLTRKREELLKKLFSPTDELYAFTDNLSGTILQHFGLLIIKRNEGTRDEGTIGSQFRLLKDVLNYRDEYQFCHSLELLAALRNAHSHENTLFAPQLYHKYIIFTFVGLTYICRRIWKKYGEDWSFSCMGNGQRKICPEEARVFKMPSEQKTITIKAPEGETAHKTEELKYSYDKTNWKKLNTPDNKGIETNVDVTRYQPLYLKIKYYNEPEPVDITIMPDYYSFWEDTVVIIQPRLVQPFHERKIDDSIKEKLAEIYNKSNDLPKQVRSVVREVMNSKLSNLEPTIQMIAEKSVSEKKLAEFSSVLEELNIKTDEIITKIDISQIEDNIQTIRKNISESLSSVDEKIQRLVEKHEGERNGHKVIIKWSRTNTVISIVILIAVAILLFERFCGSKTAEELIAEGDSFLLVGDSAAAERAYADALNIFNKRLGDNDEERISQARHYLSLGNTEIAYRLIEPIASDLKSHPEASLVAAEILFEKGDFGSVKSIVEDYKSVVNDSTPIAMRLEGIMRIKGRGGYAKDNGTGAELLSKAAIAGDMQANYMMGCLFTDDINDWSPIPDRDNNYVVKAVAVDIASGVDCLRKAAPTVIKAAIKLGQVYAKLNMTDSAEYYFNKVLKMTDEGMDLNNQAKYGLGLLLEKKGAKDNPYLRELRLAKYKEAMLHDALKGENPEAVIDIFSSMDYKGPRYLNPKALAYIALGKKDEALKTLVAQHKDGGFTMEFVDGIEKLLGTKYAYQDSVEGMRLIRSAAESGCDYARMLCLYRDIEHNLLAKSQMELMDVFALEKLGEEIPFAYVLASFMFSTINWVDRAQWAALKAMNCHHPAGAMAVVSTYGKYTDEYFYRVWKSEGECLKLYTTIQDALMNSPEKELCLELSILTDKASYNLRKIGYPLWRLDFWADVAIANNFTNIEYSLLFALSQYKENSTTITKIEKKLCCSLLAKLNLSKIEDKRLLERLESTLYDLSINDIDSLKRVFKGKVDALTVINNRKHYNPQSASYTQKVFSLKLPIQNDAIFFEFSDIAENDRFGLYFEKINSREK